MTVEERALLYRYDKVLETMERQDIDPLEALAFVVAPPRHILEKSIEVVISRPFVDPTTSCTHGHMRTEQNMRFRANGTFCCRICESRYNSERHERRKLTEDQERRRAKKRELYRRRRADPEQWEKEKERKRRSHHKRMQDPDYRARRVKQTAEARERHRARKRAEEGTT